MITFHFQDFSTIIVVGVPQAGIPPTFYIIEDTKIYKLNPVAQWPVEFPVKKMTAALVQSSVQYRKAI